MMARTMKCLRVNTARTVGSEAGDGLLLTMMAVARVVLFVHDP